MFDTEKVKVYLVDVFPDLDGEKKIIKLRCYVNPCSHELAREVDPEIASVLFHKLGNEMAPRSIAHHMRFTKNIKPQAMNFCRDMEFGTQVQIPAVSISKLEAGKVTPESNDWALMFTVAFEKHDPKVLNELSDLMHEHFYLTFAELQPGLFDHQDAVMDLICRLCDAPNPEYVTTDNKFGYCEKCSVNKEDGETLRRIRDKQAAVEVASELREPGDEEEEEPREDPLVEDINRRNQMGRRKKKAARHVN